MTATPLSFSHIAAGSPWWVFAAVVAALVFHIGGGSVGILSGTAAVTVAKGERLHRRFGTVFVLAMLVMASFAVGLAVFLTQIGVTQQKSNLAAGIFAAYLVATAWMTVKRPAGQIGTFERIAFAVILATAGLFGTWGVMASLSPKGAFDGYLAVFYYVFAGIAALLAALDFKVILNGGISGTARIARHLWRMCLAFFFAAGSFFIGQQKVMPAFLHGSPVLIALGVAPLAVMAFWLVRVRFWKPREPTAVAAE